MAKNNNIYLDPSILEDGRLKLAQAKMLEMLKVVDAICIKHNLDYWLDRGTFLGAVRHQGFIPWDDDIDLAMPRASYEAFLKIAPSLLPKHLFLQTSETDPGYFNLAAPLKIRDRNSRFIEKHESGQETYQQGVFLDVFTYDKLYEDAKQRKRTAFLAKKILRLLSTKYCTVSMGHHAGLYKFVGKFFSKAFLEKTLHSLITHANESSSQLLGYGYDSIKNNCFEYKEIYPLQRITFEDGEFNIVHNPEAVLTKIYGDYKIPPPEHKRKPNHCKALEI
jgi:lipopolysaccharide cholinephosphotransferase